MYNTGTMTKTEYYRRLVDIFLAYKRRRTVLTYAPIRLWIEPTSHCNLKCVMCPNKDLKPADRGFMDVSLFRSLIDEMRDSVHEINLTHRGESLLHPEFFDMVRYAAGSGVVTKLHTNATLLDEDKARALLESGLDQLTFSFDGYDKEAYEKIRVNADFDKTLARIEGFLRLKKDLQARKPYTILELIDFPEIAEKNPGGRKAFLQKFKDLPVDHIRIKEMHNWAGEISPRPEKTKYSPCTFLWASLIIFWDGRVLPCTQDFHGVLSPGRFGRESLMDIWNSGTMVELREKAVRGDIDDLHPCRACDRPWRKRFLGVPRDYLLRLLLRRMP